MNLRGAEGYSIGLDLGTNSVGWAVVGPDGRILHVKGKPAWGARIFSGADSAANRRMNRSQRRRYARRRQRIDALQSLFAGEMDKVDSEFFIRMNASYLRPDDPDSHRTAHEPNPLFNGSDFTEHDYYERFPTIWHLRKYLMEAEGKEDIRLVYLALHNIVKYRGNFLYQDQPSLNAKNADMSLACKRLSEALTNRAEQLGLAGIAADPAEIEATFQKGAHAREISDQLGKQVIKTPGVPKMAAAIGKACAGYVANFVEALGLEKDEVGDANKFSLADEEKVNDFDCPDDAVELFEALRAVHSSYVLQELLSYAPGQTISNQFIKQYEAHRDDLKALKQLVRKYCPDRYAEFFRGPKFSDGAYDFNRVATPSYTAYILGEKLCNKKGCNHDSLVKAIRKMLDPEKVVGLTSDPVFLEIKDRLFAEDSDFLKKQKVRDNGAIPYQLHLEEMDAIIKNQGRFYPFLIEHRDEMERIVSSRIPYYVGPLGINPDQGAPFDTNPVDPTRKFAWSRRQPGKEHVRAYPWNIDEVIDKDATAELFIRRMTGTCTYLYGESVLPSHSLLYEEFCVLNELNGARWRMAGSDWERFDQKDREGIINDLFRQRATVPYRAISDWMRRKHGHEGVEVRGGQKEEGFASSLDSYRFFKGVLGVDDLDESLYPMIEDLVLWCTLFEDRDILRRKVEQRYGNRLSEKQIDKICKKRFTGWGRLSRKLLVELKVDDPQWGTISIMDVLRYGNPYNHGRTVIFQEVIRDRDLGFKDAVERENEGKSKDMKLDDLPGSPMLRRPINQALRIVDELVGIAGHAPARICIEETRDDDLEKRNSRTTTRERALRDAYKKLLEEVEGEQLRAAKEDDKQLKVDLDEYKGKLDSERVMLYFAQRGKSLYSGKTLDIRKLSSYEVDHILPRSYIKDDSLENKALVLHDENQLKSDDLLLDESIRRKMAKTWEALHAAGLMGDKKYRNLMRDHISDKAMEGFINRQLVETSQVVKFTRLLLAQRFPDTQIATVRANTSHGIRENANFPKCRIANNYHHAQDAYLACQASRFVNICYPDWENGINLSYVRRQFHKLAEERVGSNKLPGRSGFIADMFMRQQPDEETGELIWDGPAEIAAMRKELYCKQCFVTRMPEIRSGAFWNETIYSPRDAKKGENLEISLKKGLDPHIYGGPSGKDYAYFCAFVARNKKGKDEYYLAGVPLYLADSVADSKEGAMGFARSVVKPGSSDIRIIRARVPFIQKFELDGDELYIGGYKQVMPAREPSFSFEDYSTLCKVDDWLRDGKISGSELRLSDDDLTRIYDVLAEKIKKNCSRLYSLLKLKELRPSFAVATIEDRCSIISTLMQMGTGKITMADLEPIGGNKHSGYIQLTYTKNLGEMTFIDTSVTGIFERRQSVKDILHGL